MALPMMSSSTPIGSSRCSSAAGMTAAFGVGDGTRCRAALCHTLCKGIIWNKYFICSTLNMKVLGVPALQYLKTMPLQLTNRKDMFLQQQESGKCKMTFKGHTDHLHSIAVRETNHQVVTGSEDGTARIWDCKSRKCTQMILPVQNKRLVALLVVYQFGVFSQTSASLMWIVVPLFKICCLTKTKF